MANSLNLLIATVAAVVSLSMALQVALPVAMGCRNMVDLYFIVDASWSVCDLDPTYNKATDKTCKNWNDIISLMHTTVEQLDIGEEASRVAVVVFSSNADSGFNLTAYMDKESVLAAIDSLQYTRDTTNTPARLDVMITMAFSSSGGHRPNIPNTSVIITDGIITDGYSSVLLPIDQSGKTHFIVTNFAQPEEKASELVKEICRISKNIQP